MGQKFIIGLNKKGKSFQIPIEKYSMSGEVAGISTDEVKKIGDSLGVDWGSTDMTQLYAGTQVEAKEHSDIMNGRLEVAVRIALAHLKEIPDYYTRLKAMEMKAEKPAISGNIQNVGETENVRRGV